jgi:hypothetical protein
MPPRNKRNKNNDDDDDPEADPLLFAPRTKTIVFLRTWVLTLVPTAVKGDFDTEERFQSKYGEVVPYFVYSVPPAQLRLLVQCDWRSALVLVPKAELEPLQFHLANTKVFVFNPYWYKPLWKCEVGAMQHLLHACHARPCNRLTTCRLPAHTHTHTHTHTHSHTHNIHTHTHTHKHIIQELKSPTCKIGELKGAGWSNNTRRVIGFARSSFVVYSKLKCNKCGECSGGSSAVKAIMVGM